jgi:hypothetical protein
MRVHWSGRMFFRILRNLLDRHLQHTEGASAPDNLDCVHDHGMPVQRH